MLRNKETVGVAASRQNTVLGENDRKAEEDVVGRTRERAQYLHEGQKTTNPELWGLESVCTLDLLPSVRCPEGRPAE
jgi:hypothetical protein